MATKLYFHAATTGDTGTLPSTKLSTATVNVTATGASTNRDMSTTIGTSQTSVSLSTVASISAQSNWFARFVSAPLAAQTIAAQTCVGTIGADESSTNSTFTGVFFETFLWRPGSGAKIGAIYSGVANPLFTGSTTEVSSTATNLGTSTSQTALAGDIIVVEIWSLNQIQGMATSYTNTIFFDGTTELSATTNAAYINFPNTLTFSGGSTAITAALAPSFAIAGTNAEAVAVSGVLD